jgi:aldose 1-epimerase
VIGLEAGEAFVEVSPTDGGRLARLRVGTRELLIRGDSSDNPLVWGSYPMAPWAGRVRHGRFEFGGSPREMPINMAPHSIHGTVFNRRWEVIDAGFDHAELECPLDWSFGGRANQHLQLTPEALVCVLSVVAGGEPMPATIGWHPWFVKPSDDRLGFDAMYLRDDEHVPTGALVEPPARPWDDCFIGAHHPLQLRYEADPGNPGLVVTVAGDCDHWVVYDQPIHATCVEPQSGPPDAFNIGGATVVAPGEMLQRTMTISWASATR